jgi:hypothetical protein
MQNVDLLLKDIEDGLGGFAGYESAEDLMLEQIGPCSTLKFIQSRYKERFQLWRGMDRHRVERVVEIDGGDYGCCNTADNRPDTRDPGAAALVGEMDGLDSAMRQLPNWDDRRAETAHVCPCGDETGTRSWGSARASDIAERSTESESMSVKRPEGRSVQVIPPLLPDPFYVLIFSLVTVLPCLFFFPNVSPLVSQL